MKSTYLFEGMGKVLLLIITLITFVVTCACAQTTLTGTVRDAKNQPLPGILLEVETKAQPPASAFVISAADGSFRLTLPPTPAS